jgi:hypothetical protein
LHYDSQREETLVTCEDQPLPQGVILYRNRRRDHRKGRDGRWQTWTTNPEQAEVNGEVTWALLPPHAKRLVLVDVATGAYQWEQITELENLTNTYCITERLRNHVQLHRLWDDQWLEHLKQAGYDSVATVGIEGPEEYILNPAKLMPLSHPISTAP